MKWHSDVDLSEGECGYRLCFQARGIKIDISGDARRKPEVLSQSRERTDAFIMSRLLCQSNINL
jgi:hypothetical protein